jgi:hypothetical protein
MFNCLTERIDKTCRFTGSTGEHGRRVTVSCDSFPDNESLLKGNLVKTPLANFTLGSALQYLHNELGIPSNLYIGNTDFPTIISDLAGADDSIQTAIQFTGRIRNTLGHNLGWIVMLDKTNYRRLFRMVSSSCLHAISCLYP